MRYVVAVCLLLAAAPAAKARPVIVELFTSQACSSCPPADALLGTLKKDTAVLPLSFHVSYWNGPGWTDPFSLTAATDRQSWYAGLAHSDQVYTPEAIVDGEVSMVGSDRGKVMDAIANAKAALPPEVPISVTGGAMLTIRIADGSGQATVWLFGFDARHVTKIGGGENGGATLTETNVVRSMSSLGGWSGTRVGYTIPKPLGEHVAVLLQDADGRVLGAAAD